MKQGYRKLLGVSIGLFVIVDTKNLYDTISTKSFPTEADKGFDAIGCFCRAISNKFCC